MTKPMHAYHHHYARNLELPVTIEIAVLKMCGTPSRKLGSS